VRLLAPSGESLFLRVPGVGAPAGSSWVDLAFDEQSTFRTCDPTIRLRADCNYLLSGTTYTGKLHTSFRPTFKNTNPKGTWTLGFRDRQPGNEPAAAIGVSTLVLKTGKRFEKE
jgi:hypothetical protein